MKISSNKLIYIVALFFVLFANYSFFNKTLEVYPANLANIGFLLSLALLLWSVIVIFLTLFGFKKTLKPIIIALLMISSFTAYFMDSYGIIIDDSMLVNTAQTNMSESMDLLSLEMFLYFIFLGLLPSLFVYFSKVEYINFKSELKNKLKAFGLSLVLIGVSVFAFSGHYASFFREHKPLRYHTNPTYWIYSVIKFSSSTLKKEQEFKVLDTNPNIKEENDKNHKELIIMVVGEAVRSDHFSLNGYSKETNPQLRKEDIVNFSNLTSCGTSTAHSVPCMFSQLTRETFDKDEAKYTQNALDILAKTGHINVLWRDNNSDSKDVATRLTYEDFKNPKNNTICDDECRDEGMLVGLDTYIQKHKDEDILIVLHQMGNHGPAYYKRYPKSFEKFKPVCETNQLESCTNEQISNAYDNAILYTDDFLVKTINFLKKYDGKYETAMIYMSDHGESLGENGVYLHGLPYMVAPDAQKRVGALMWFGNTIRHDFDYNKVVNSSKNEYSHDNLFHTLLGIFEIQSEVYEKEMDILHGSK